MGEDGKIIYKVVIDDADAASEGEAAGRKAGDGVERGASRGTGAFKEMMLGAARAIGEAFVEMAAKAVQGVEQIAKAGIEFNAKMETYQTAFTTLIGDADQAAAAIERIRQDAASTPFDVDSLTSANQALLATGMDAEKARGDVMNLANAIAATGGGSAELSRMAANMQQIRNTGKATAMDIRQFANAGINIYGILGDYLGISAKKAAELDVTYEQLTGAFAHAAEAGGMYAGALEAQSQTFNGRMSTLKDNALQLAGALTEDLFNKLSGEGLPMVMDWVATLLEAAQTGGIEGAIAAAKDILSNLLQTFLDSLPSLLDTGLTMLESIIGGITEAIPKIIEVGQYLVITLLTALVNHAPQLITAGLKLLTTLATSLFDMRDTLLDTAVNLVMTLVKGLIDNAPELLMAAAELIATLLYGILTEIPHIVTAIFTLIGDLVEAFTSTDWASVGSAIVSGVWSGITGLWGWLVGELQSAVDNLWQSAKRALGIASPSKKFKYIGEMSVEGIEEGFEDGEQELNRTVNTVYNSMLGAATGSSVPSSGNLENAVSYNLAATGGGYTIVVPLFLDGQEIARATAWSMGQQLAWQEI